MIWRNCLEINKDQKTVESGVILYLTQCHQGLMRRLQPLIDQRKDLKTSEDVSFQNEIDEQFFTLLRKEIAQEIAENMFFDPEQVFLIVESMDVKSFINKNVGWNENTKKN